MTFRQRGGAPRYYDLWTCGVQASWINFPRCCIPKRCFGIDSADEVKESFSLQRID